MFKIWAWLWIICPKRCVDLVVLYFSTSGSNPCGSISGSVREERERERDVTDK
jgi:hypothetical protein